MPSVAERALLRIVYSKLHYLLLIIGIALSMQSGFIAPAFADGGKVQVDSKRSGPYSLTVFTSPSPIQVGTVDVSVLVGKRDSASDLIQNAHVKVSARPVGHKGTGGTFDATHSRATNKLFYAANVKLPSEGKWRITVNVSGSQGKGSAAFDVVATSAGVGGNLLFVLLLILFPVLLVIWWIARSRYTKTSTRSKTRGWR